MSTPRALDRIPCPPFIKDEVRWSSNKQTTNHHSPAVHLQHHHQHGHNHGARSGRPDSMSHHQQHGHNHGVASVITIDGDATLPPPCHVDLPAAAAATHPSREGAHGPTWALLAASSSSAPSSSPPEISIDLLQLGFQPCFTEKTPVRA